MTTAWIYTLWNWRGSLLHCKAILQGGLVRCFEGKVKAVFAAGPVQENAKFPPQIHCLTAWALLTPTLAVIEFQYLQKKGTE